MRRTVCSACGSADLIEFLDLGTSPVADAYTDKPDGSAGVTCRRYPLQLAVCGRCWLVQLLEVLDGETLFGTGYSFYSSASAPLSAYHAEYARDVLMSHHGELARSGVLEIGCNDGDFLQHFKHLPHVGFDPAGGPVAVARDRGLNVLGRAFDGTALATGEKFGLVIANHVLAHVADVADVLAGIAAALIPNGVAFVEVQYLPDLLVNNAFDLVYHEHRNFFSLSSLAHAATRAGLRVIDAELTDRQGGSLRVTLSKALRLVSPRVYTIQRSEDWLRTPAAYIGMQGRAERIRARLWDLLAAEQGAGRTVAGYGAPAKATTLFAFCGFDESVVSYMTDTTKSKQGRYLPGTAIPILPPDHRSSGTRLVTAWNYLPQILKHETRFTNDGGRWLVPLPAPVVL